MLHQKSKIIKKIFCTNCKKRIYRSIGRMNENLKLRHNFYCSKKCEFQYKSKKQLLVCENCGEFFTRSPHAFSPHNYCSRSCAVMVNNKKHSKRKAEFKTCMSCGRQFKKSMGNLKFCSIKCRVEAKRKYTPEQLIDIIKLTAQELKRVPAKRELKIARACEISFGSWNNAIIAAELQPNRSHSQRMYKCINAKALDGHLCDSISEVIIDNWLTANKIPHERNILYPGTNHKADWSVNFGNRNIFIEYFGLANDSPRYDRSVRKKKLICEKYKLKLIEIYPRDLYPEICLDAILKNEFKKLGWRK